MVLKVTLSIRNTSFLFSPYSLVTLRTSLILSVVWKNQIVFVGFSQFLSRLEFGLGRFGAIHNDNVVS